MRAKSVVAASAILLAAAGLTWVTIAPTGGLGASEAISPGTSAGRAANGGTLDGTGQKTPDRPAYGLLSSPFGVLECANKQSRHYHAESCDAAHAPDPLDVPDPIDSATLTSVAEKARRGAGFEFVGIILTLEYLGCSGSSQAAEGWNETARRCHMHSLQPDALMLEGLLRDRAQQGLPGSVATYVEWLQTRAVVLLQAVDHLAALVQQHPADERLKQDFGQLMAAKSAAFTRLEEWEALALR